MAYLLRLAGACVFVTKGLAKCIRKNKCNETFFKIKGIITLSQNECSHMCKNASINTIRRIIFLGAFFEFDVCTLLENGLKLRLIQVSKKMKLLNSDLNLQYFKKLDRKKRYMLY